MATKKKAAGSKATSKTTSKKVAAKAPAKLKAAKPPKEDLVVFAFRLTLAEREGIHKTAGPANASRFVRQVCGAFAQENEGAFRAVLKEAKELRS